MHVTDEELEPEGEGDPLDELLHDAWDIVEGHAFKGPFLQAIEAAFQVAEENAPGGIRDHMEQSEVRVVLQYLLGAVINSACIHAVLNELLARSERERG